MSSIEKGSVTDIKLTYQGRMNKFFENGLGTRIVDEFRRNGTVIDVGCSGGITTLDLLRIFDANISIGIDLDNPIDIAKTYTSFAPKPTVSEASKLKFYQRDMFNLSELPLPKADLIIFGNNIMNYMLRTGDMSAGAKILKQAYLFLNDEGKIIFLQNGIFSRIDLLIFKKVGLNLILDMTNEELKFNPFEENIIKSLINQTQ